MELFSYGCPNHGMNDLMQKLIPTEEKMVNPNTDSDEHNLFFFLLAKSPAPVFVGSYMKNVSTVHFNCSFSFIFLGIIPFLGIKKGI